MEIRRHNFSLYGYNNAEEFIKTLDGPIDMLAGVRKVQSNKASLANKDSLFQHEVEEEIPMCGTVG